MVSSVTGTNSLHSNVPHGKLHASGAGICLQGSSLKSKTGLPTAPLGEGGLATPSISLTSGNSND